MEFLYFILVSLILYWLADRILVAIERHRGEQMQNRTIIFFLILLTLAVGSFALIRRFL
jgi:hypothetical protein